MSSSFCLPRLTDQERIAARLYAEEDKWPTCARPTVACTLADLQAATAEEDLRVYEASHPTGLPIGKRWLTRSPRCWEALCPLAPIFLVEVLCHSGRDAILWPWRLEIEGDALVQAWLRVLGDRAERLIQLVKVGQHRQLYALINKEGSEVIQLTKTDKAH